MGSFSLNSNNVSLVTNFIEFQTNECVSDDKETINRSIQNRVQLLLLLFPDVSKIYSIVPADDGVDLQNVWEQQQLYSILYRSVNGLFVI